MAGHDLAQNVYVILGRLLLALVLGAVLGLERERRERPAGLRTHILVTVTTCLVVLVGLASASADNAGRIAQGVVTGIGFLGAGTIMRHGDVVRGLTTAASVWAAASIGVAVGFGAYLGAVVATAVVFITLTLLRSAERLIHQEPGALQVQADLAPGTLFPAGLEQYLLDNGVDLTRLEMAAETPGRLLLGAEVGKLSTEAVLALVKSAPGIAHAEVVKRPPTHL
jgi:uncharacterized membrane protein YhiD involved in acid resistance